MSDCQHVRNRPSMYLGDTTSRGLHHLVREIVANSVEEANAGFASTIEVEIRNDGAIAIKDDGRGIPVERDEELSKVHNREFTTLEGLMTLFKYRSPRSTNFPTKVGLHGVGMTVVNFLSSWMEVEVRCDRKTHRQRFECGAACGPVLVTDSTSETGTTVSFLPDPAIFPTAQTEGFDFAVIEIMLRELASLNSGMRFRFLDRRTGQTEEFCFKNGLVDLFKDSNRPDNPRPSGKNIVHLKSESGTMHFEIAMGWQHERVNSYANNVRTLESGKHVDGFFSAVTAAINHSAEKLDILKGITIAREDYEDDLIALISIRLPDPQMEGPTKTSVANCEIEEVIHAEFRPYLEQFLDENRHLVHRIVRAAKKRRRDA